MLHKFSIGFKSTEQTGQGRSSIQFLSMWFLAGGGLCTSALLCIKNYVLFTLPVLRSAIPQHMGAYIFDILQTSFCVIRLPKNTRSSFPFRNALQKYPKIIILVPINSTSFFKIITNPFKTLDSSKFLLKFIYSIYLLWYMSSLRLAVINPFFIAP